FMLAANETVAFHLESHGVPFLYRIHEEPDEDKMESLGELVKEFGGVWPSVDKIRPVHLSRVLKALEGRPEERFINTVMLRSMKQARYSPDNAGHFGLASRCYCHFTSPIRRYPDLSVHRGLKELLKKGELAADRKGEMAGGLAALGLHTSAMEREAEAAEREVVELKKLQFMIDKVGAQFEGFINGVTAFGFFVELDEYFVEGLVRLTSMHDDYYSYEEKRHALIGRHTGKTHRLGDRVTVRVERVDMEQRHLDFSLVGAEPTLRGPRASLWEGYRKASAARKGAAPGGGAGKKPRAGAGKGPGGGPKKGGKGGGKAGKKGGHPGRKGR
ncbi:MAG TPA: RNB domain-containing ribonuclease, partial [Nitrospirota bacterium]